MSVACYGHDGLFMTENKIRTVLVKDVELAAKKAGPRYHTKDFWNMRINA